MSNFFDDPGILSAQDHLAALNGPTSAEAMSRLQQQAGQNGDLDGEGLADGLDVVGDLVEDGGDALEMVSDLWEAGGEALGGLLENGGELLAGAGEALGGLLENGGELLAGAGELLGGAGELIGGLLGSLADL